MSDLLSLLGDGKTEPFQQLAVSDVPLPSVARDQGAEDVAKPQQVAIINYPDGTTTEVVLDQSQAMPSSAEDTTPLYWGPVFNNDSFLN